MSEMHLFCILLNMLWTYRLVRIVTSEDYYSNIGTELKVRDEHRTHFPSVKVVYDGEMEAFLSLPLALHGVREELSERPFSPFQEFIIQQQGVRRFYKQTHTYTVQLMFYISAMEKTRTLHYYKYKKYHVLNYRNVTSVILCLQMQLIELVNIPDVHFFLVQLSFVEVLMDERQKAHIFIKSPNYQNN